MKMALILLFSCCLILIWSEAAYAMPVIPPKSEFPLDCMYLSNDQFAELDSYPGCAVRKDITLRISPTHLQSLSFSEYDLAAVFVEGVWYYVNCTGQTLPVLTYDNGPDNFEEGLVRSRVNGKVAYYDALFRQIIQPNYDWAWPFSEGRALVCTECKTDALDTREHIPVLGGLWGYIDRNGKEVVPVRYTREEVKNF